MWRSAKCRLSEVSFHYWYEAPSFRIAFEAGLRFCPGNCSLCGRGISGNKEGGARKAGGRLSQVQERVPGAGALLVVVRQHLTLAQVVIQLFVVLIWAQLGCCHHDGCKRRQLYVHRS